MGWERHQEGVDPCVMNVISTGPFAGTFVCLALTSCHLGAPLDSNASTVVWDIHSAPPASGHAFLVQPAAPLDGVWANQWTLLSDTLNWDPTTGEVAWHHVPLDAWWHIESTDPCHPGTTRVSRFPATTDTCLMTSQTTLHLVGKMHRTVGNPVKGYRLEFKEDRVSDWRMAETWSMTQGVIQHTLPLPLSEGPWSFRLVRIQDQRPPKVIHDTTTIACEEEGWSWTWNDLDTPILQP